jgi:hypothetical protein
MALLAVAAAVPLPPGREAHSREDAARFRAKIEAITRHAEAGAPAPLTTAVTEREINAYLAYDAVAHLPIGLTDPRIAIQPDLSLSGTATIDLDAIRKQRTSRGWLDPLNYLGGTVPVAVAGRLAATGGVARFSLASAKVGGVTVPKVVVQELLSFYTRTDADPRGLNLDDPYPLPARIRQIDVRPGEALVRQ